MSRCAADRLDRVPSSAAFKVLRLYGCRTTRASCSEFIWLTIPAVRQVWQGDAHWPALAGLMRPLEVQSLLVAGDEHVVANPVNQRPVGRPHPVRT